MTDGHAPHALRLAFSLRTCSSCVTALALWLGWNAHQCANGKDVAMIHLHDRLCVWRNRRIREKLYRSRANSGAEPVEPWVASELPQRGLGHIESLFPEAEVVVLSREELKEINESSSQTRRSQK